MKRYNIDIFINSVLFPKVFTSTRFSLPYANTFSFMNKLTKIIEDNNKDIAKIRVNRDETLFPLVANESDLAQEKVDEAVDEDNSEENTSEYSDVNFNELTEHFNYKETTPRQDNEGNRVVYSKSSDNIYQLRGRTAGPDRRQLIYSEGGRKRWESLDRTGYIQTPKHCCHNSCRSDYERNCSSEQDIRFLQLEEQTRKNEPAFDQNRISETFKLLQSEPSNFVLRNRKLRVFWEVEPLRVEKSSILEASSPFLKPSYHVCCERRKHSDLQKKRVRFSVCKMEGDLNFRVTLSIKNEADGQTVFYKVSPPQYNF